jgi:hypothetical protein
MLPQNNKYASVLGSKLPASKPAAREVVSKSIGAKVTFSGAEMQARCKRSRFSHWIE